MPAPAAIRSASAPAMARAASPSGSRLPPPAPATLFTSRRASPEGLTGTACPASNEDPPETGGNPMRTASGRSTVLLFLAATSLATGPVGCGTDEPTGREGGVVARCGDGHLDPGESCDAGSLNSDTTPGACRLDCTPPRCGDRKSTRLNSSHV